MMLAEWKASLSATENGAYLMGPLGNYWMLSSNPGGSVWINARPPISDQVYVLESATDENGQQISQVRVDESGNPVTETHLIRAGKLLLEYGEPIAYFDDGRPIYAACACLPWEFNELSADEIAAQIWPD